MTPLDELGLAITNAGYTWTPEMRKAYEKGVREQNKKIEWVGLTEDEAIELLPVGDWEIESTLAFSQAIEAKLKQKNANS